MHRYYACDNCASFFSNSIGSRDIIACRKQGVDLKRVNKCF